MMMAELTASPIPQRNEKHITWLCRITCGISGFVLPTSLANSRSFSELKATFAPILLVSQVTTLIFIFEFVLALLLILPPVRPFSLQSEFSAILTKLMLSFRFCSQDLFLRQFRMEKQP